MTAWNRMGCYSRHIRPTGSNVHDTPGSSPRRLLSDDPRWVLCILPWP